MARESSRRYSSSIVQLYQNTRRPSCLTPVPLFGIKLLMSSLVISSKYVDLDSKGIGTVTLKNVRNNSQGPQHTILFKVKTNLKDSVNVRPGYGLILPSVAKDTAHIQVKYNGGEAELPKAKLMISWIAIERIIVDSKIPHEEFKQLFENEVRVSEGTTLMPFNDHSKENRDVSSNQQQQSSQQESETSDLLREKKEKEDLTDVESKFESLASDLTQKNSNGSQISHAQGYSLKVLLLVFLFSFICGVIVGWQIPQPSLPISPASDQRTQSVEHIVDSANPSTKEDSKEEQADL